MVGVNLISRIDLEASVESHHSELKVLQLRFTGSITNVNHSRSVRWIAAESSTLNRPIMQVIRCGAGTDRLSEGLKFLSRFSITTQSFGAMQVYRCRDG